MDSTTVLDATTAVTKAPIFFGATMPFIIVSSIFGFIGIICPLFVPLIFKPQNRGVAIVVLVETAVCCYIFWVCVTLMQLNPLLGPTLSNTTIYIMQHEWN